MALRRSRLHEGIGTEEDHRIAAPRQVLTARAARWATLQVGRHARSVNEVAGELGCDWHTVNGIVVAYGEALLEADEDRIGEVSALGLDELLMVRVGHFQRLAPQGADTSRRCREGRHRGAGRAGVRPAGGGAGLALRPPAAPRPAAPATLGDVNRTPATSLSAVDLEHGFEPVDGQGSSRWTSPNSCQR